VATLVVVAASEVVVAAVVVVVTALVVVAAASVVVVLATVLVVVDADEPASPHAVRTRSRATLSRVLVRNLILLFEEG
jgi:hypothetical protein